MRWDDRLVQLFEDLEQQAEGMHLADRDGELADRSRAEYSSVSFEARVHASVGARLRLSVSGVGTLAGTLVRAGKGWLLLETSTPGQEWVVCLDAVTQAAGLSGRAVNELARPVSGRLPLRSALRGLADAQVVVTVHHSDGTQSAGRLGRVGADFVELLDRDGDVLPLAMVSAVRRTGG